MLSDFFVLLLQILGPDGKSFGRGCFYLPRVVGREAVLRGGQGVRNAAVIAPCGLLSAWNRRMYGTSAPAHTQHALVKG